MGKKIAVGILGGTGFGAGELLRLLAAHPEAAVVAVTSTSQVGTPLSAAHPHLAGFYDALNFEAQLQAEHFAGYEQKIVFAALPHGKSASGIAELLDSAAGRGVRVIDLSGDFRLQNKQSHASFYPEAVAAPALRSKFVYGLSEINSDRIAQAECVANPGCLAGSCALAVLPLMSADFRGSIVFDAKTGSSGGGKSLAEAMHHPFRHANVNAYKILAHRHEPEIRETLGDVSGERIETTFVPHLLPISRGIFATAYLNVERERSTQELREVYAEFYRRSPFIRIREGSPDLNSVIGSNFCDISVFARGRQVVAMATLDNLVKGMAGQAIQNMNIMTGLSETAGLWTPSIALL
jgi:N-acetyl-gamma-glutamyl-phosphate reductase